MTHTHTLVPIELLAHAHIDKPWNARRSHEEKRKKIYKKISLVFHIIDR